VTYRPIPSGTYCQDRYDPVSGQYYAELEVGGEIDYGRHYAFEFGAQNPRFTPEASLNVWRYETMMKGVILHLRQRIEGFPLEEIKLVMVTPEITTTEKAGRIEFSSERTDLEAAIKKLHEEIEEAEDIREKEHEDYLAAKDEMEKAIAALEKAVETIDEATFVQEHKGSMLLCSICRRASIMSSFTLNTCHPF